MINLGKARWPVLVVLPCAVVAGLFQFNLVGLNFQSEALLTYKGELKKMPSGQAGYRIEKGAAKGTVRVVGQGSTPAGAVRSAENGATALTRSSLDQKKTQLDQKIIALKNQQNTLSSRRTGFVEERESAAKGSRRAWTPQMAERLAKADVRRRYLVENYPTHTDIPVLAAEIKSLDAAKRGQVKIDPARVSDVGRRVAETQTQIGMLDKKIAALSLAKKGLSSDWKLIQPASAPRWPVSVPGWPLASGSAAAIFVLGFFVTRSRVSRPASGSAAAPIALELVTDDSRPLPDDPQTRKAAALYQRWLALVETVYALGAEAPKNIYTGAEPLFKETVAFLDEGKDSMTRHLARVVIPGDLYSHVARTVVMALIGAYEAGASTTEQQGMTYAALFHDLAVAPRPANAWHEVGSEVGRLSSGLLRKIPGIPAPLLAMTEEILVAMDEYPAETWQNVPRSEAVASFAKLLGYIDRFDKVLQKQKTRLVRLR